MLMSNLLKREQENRRWRLKSKKWMMTSHSDKEYDMKAVCKIMLASLLTLCTGTGYSQEPVYRNGLNGEGSYHSRGGTNHPSGVFVNGNRYNFTYMPYDNANRYRYPTYNPYTGY